MAEFPIPLDQCLLCDCRRVEQGDEVSIILDPDKFPLQQPVVGFVTEVRSPAPPDPPATKMTIVVVVDDDDMPGGLTILEPADIQTVKCITCCENHETRLGVLESLAETATETLYTPFEPFIVTTLNVKADLVSNSFFPDINVNLEFVGSDINGFLQWSYDDGTVITTLNRQPDGAGGWIWALSQSNGLSLFADMSPVQRNLPWLSRNPGLEADVWTQRPVAPGTTTATVLFKALEYDFSAPTLPSVFGPQYKTGPATNLDQRLIFARTDSRTLWYWTGMTFQNTVDNVRTWKPVNEAIPWDGATSLVTPSNRIGIFYRATSNFNYYGLNVYQGDVLMRVAPNPVFLFSPQTHIIRIGNDGRFSATAVTLFGNQTITGFKTFTNTATFAGANINQIFGNQATFNDVTTINIDASGTAEIDTLIAAGGVINNTTIGLTTAAAGGFTSLISNSLALGRPGLTNGSIDFGQSGAMTVANLKVATGAGSVTITIPRITGYTAMTSDPNGLVLASAVSGLRSGTATLVAGSAVVGDGTITAASRIVVTPTSSAANTLSVVAGIGGFTVTSTSGTDTRSFHWISIT